MQRLGYLDMRIKGKYTIFTLNFVPRYGESVFKKELQKILNKIGDEFGYECTFNDEKLYWVTHKDVYAHIDKLEDWLNKNNIKLRLN